jgi:hypothetical protein
VGKTNPVLCYDLYRLVRVVNDSSTQRARRLMSLVSFEKCYLVMSLLTPHEVRSKAI